jgi:7-carboxy-7-deazaguanine synthase
MTRYSVNDVYATIQGEGAMAGTPMVLIRLQGCGVGCPFCDTRETWLFNDKGNQVDTLKAALGTSPRWAELPGSEIAAHARLQYGQLEWVLLTGGEPAAQNLYDLCLQLAGAGFKIALETSGTERGHLFSKLDWVCVSPKVGMPGGKVVDAEVVYQADELKFVIGRQSHLNDVDEFLTNYNTRPETLISLQPMSQNERATQICLQTALERGYRLSLQIHKFIDQR